MRLEKLKAISNIKYRLQPITLLLLIILPGWALGSELQIEMVEVKGGCFQMGETFGERPDKEEKPEHRVCVGDFAIGRFEITQRQWEVIMEYNPSYFKKPGSNYPVENVSWEEVQDFITRLNQTTGKKYRLPTESEWEYAARSGGNKEKYAGTFDKEQVYEYAWVHKNSKENTHIVGTKKPNSLGIYDMSGNVAEWLGDWYGEDYYSNSPLNDPSGPATGRTRVVRGGSWGDPTSWARVWSRDATAPGRRNVGTGFRLVEKR